MKFRFSEKFVVDSDKEPWRREGLRVAMLGGPGSGKSWNNSLIAEQFLSQGGTVVIFQPRDEYYTLKEKFDVVSVGGVHAKDMEFALTSPSVYAKAVVHDGISMIFYTSAAEDEEKLVGWVSRFIRYILNYQEKHKRPLLLILEEAQEYAPRSASGHIAPPWVYNRMIKVFKDCFAQGRKLNIIAVASSQRPQELNFTIRQLANLTFYGKFSEQDIGYVDRNCLKYVRKQGIQVDASRLVTLGLGEWLVIMGKNTRFVNVTHKRLTKHGAETPSLEYVAPRTKKAEKTIDQLTTTIMAAVEREKQEQSELEKAKQKIRALTKRLDAAEEKARIKLSVKEMLKGGAQPAELAEKLAGLKEEKSKLLRALQEEQNRVRVLKRQLDQHKGIIEGLNQNIADLKKSLRTSNKLQQYFSSLIRDELKKTQPGFEPGGPSEITVTEDQPQLTVKRIRKSLTLSQRDLEGRIALVYAEGLLPKNKAFTTRKLNKIMTERYGRKEAYANFKKVLRKFVSWGFFEKVKAGRRWDYRIKMSLNEAREKGLLKVEEPAIPEPNQQCSKSKLK